MKVNLINNSNYGPYRRVNSAAKVRFNPADYKDLSSSSESSLRKNVREGKLLNSTKIDVEEVNARYYHTSPVSEPVKTFKAVFEVIKSDPVTYEEVVDPAKWIMPDSDKKDDAGKGENVAKNYIISVYQGDSKTSSKGLKRLKAQKLLYEKYSAGNWREPGRLVNLSF